MELRAAGSVTPTLVLRDGNFDPTKVWPDKPPTDLGWKRAEIGLSAYAGQTITLYFSSYNRVEQDYNTWTYLDDVSIVGGEPYHKAYLPAIARQTGGRAMAEPITAPAASVASDGERPPR